MAGWLPSHVPTPPHPPSPAFLGINSKLQWKICLSPVGIKELSGDGEREAETGSGLQRFRAWRGAGGAGAGGQVLGSRPPTATWPAGLRAAPEFSPGLRPSRVGGSLLEWTQSPAGRPPWGDLQAASRVFPPPPPGPQPYGVSHTGQRAMVAGQASAAGHCDTDSLPAGAHCCPGSDSPRPTPYIPGVRLAPLWLPMEAGVSLILRVTQELLPEPKRGLLWIHSPKCLHPAPFTPVPQDCLPPSLAGGLGTQQGDILQGPLLPLQAPPSAPGLTQRLSSRR